MCGRLAAFSPAGLFEELFQARGLPEEPPPRYNLAPTELLLVCRDRGRGRELALLRWGLVPPFASDPRIGAGMINARAETAAEKPSFRGALRHRRCLIATDGFYEWARSGARRQPWFVRLKGGAPFALAGLWERWTGPGGEILETCAVLVTAANALVARVHDRMPVILRPESYDLWLDPNLRRPEPLLPLLAPYPAAEMESYPVSTRVNRPDPDDPELVAPLPGS